MLKTIRNFRLDWDVAVMSKFSTNIQHPCNVAAALKIGRTTLLFKKYKPQVEFDKNIALRRSPD